MKLQAALLSVAVAFLSATCALAEDVTTLTATESAGVARQAEPVTVGVPLPKGLVRDGTELSLTADGKPLPAAFTVINRWPQDGSARWVLIDTQLDAQSKARVALGLAKGAAAPPAPGKLDVKQTAAAITVDTGAVTFAVARKGFALFDSLSLRGRPVLRAAPGGLTMSVDGTAYTSAADSASKVVIEEQNPMRVALLATGKLRDRAGKTGFDYQVRIHAFAGRPEIKVVATVIKKYGHPRRAVKINDLSLELRLADAGKLRCIMGGANSAVAGEVRPGQFGLAHAESSTEFSLGGVVDGSANPRQSKPLAIGWGALGGEVGIAAGVRRFWQMCPKAIEASGDGTLYVRLYPRQSPPLEFFTGMARTHEVLVVPVEEVLERNVTGRASDPGERLRARFIAFQAPLFPVATPQWYCASGGLGVLAPADAKLYGQYADAVDTITKRLSGIIHTLMTRDRDHWTKRGVTMDAYGWLAWGDTLHWVWQKEPRGSPWDIAWDSNYYDKPHLLLAHFARTGDGDALDFFMDATWHLMDVDVAHWDPNYPNGGASRRCPATNHVGFDPPEHKQIIINVAFDHHKSESLFERYYLTGDRFALATAMELLGHAFSPGKGRDGDYKGTRKPGHQIITLVAGYWCTGDRKYLAKAKQVIDTGIARQKQFAGGYNAKPNFTDGICAEAFSKYYIATGDKQVLASVKALCDYFKAKGYRNANAAMAHALVYQSTGESAYLDAGVRNLLAGKPGHLGKDTPMYYRSFADFCGLAARGLARKE